MDMSFCVDFFPSFFLSSSLIAKYSPYKVNKWRIWRSNLGPWILLAMSLLIELCSRRLFIFHLNKFLTKPNFIALSSHVVFLNTKQLAYKSIILLLGDFSKVIDQLAMNQDVQNTWHIIQCDVHLLNWQVEATSLFMPPLSQSCT